MSPWTAARLAKPVHNQFNAEDLTSIPVRAGDSIDPGNFEWYDDTRIKGGEFAIAAGMILGTLYLPAGPEDIILNAALESRFGKAGYKFVQQGGKWVVRVLKGGERALTTEEEALLLLEVRNAGRTTVDYSAELTRNTSNATRTLRNNLKTNTAIERPHHIIPLQMSDHKVVQAAARGGFNINGANNGINLQLSIHPQGARHPRYNAAVSRLLDNLLKRQLTDAEAALEVQTIADRLRPGLDRLNLSGQPLR
jgi:hypothetical protein